MSQLGDVKMLSWPQFMTYTRFRQAGVAHAAAIDAVWSGQRDAGTEAANP